MGGESTGCSEATTDVFVESAWFDPIRTAQTGRDHRHHLRRPVPLRPRRRSRLRGPRPGAGHAADPGALRRRGVRGPRRRRRRPRRRPPSTSTRPMWPSSPASTSPTRAYRTDPRRPRLRASTASTVTAADLAPRRRGQGRPGRGGGPHRRLRRPARRRPCRDDAAPGRRRADPAPGPHAHRPPRAGRRRLCRGGHLVASSPGRRPSCSAAATRPWCWPIRSPPTSTACAPRSCPT